MFNSPFRALTFGEILDGAFTLYRRHFLTLFVTALIPYVPVGIVSGWFAAATPADGELSVEYGVLFLLLMMVSFVAFVAMWGALTRQGAQAYTGGEVSLGDGFRQGLRAFLPTLAVGLVASIIMGVAMFAVSIVLGIAMALAIPLADESATVAVVLGIGIFLAAFAVMLALGALFFATVPAIVVERRGPFQAIGRSFSLAWGALPRVVGVLVVSYFIVMLPIAGGMIAIGLTQGFSALVEPGALSPAAIAVQQLISTVMYALTLPFFAISLVLLYFDRRARTEAHDLEGMVRGLAMAG